MPCRHSTHGKVGGPAGYCLLPACRDTDQIILIRERTADIRIFSPYTELFGKNFHTEFSLELAYLFADPWLRGEQGLGGRGYVETLIDHRTEVA